MPTPLNPRLPEQDPDGPQPGCLHDWVGPYEWQGELYVDCSLCHWSIRYEPADP